MKYTYIYIYTHTCVYIYIYIRMMYKQMYIICRTAPRSAAAPGRAASSAPGPA